MGNASSITSHLPSMSPGKPCSKDHDADEKDHDKNNDKHNKSGKGNKNSKSNKSGKKNSASNTAASATQVAQAAAESATERAKKVLGDVQTSIKMGVRKLEEQDHPAAHLIDSVCGPIFEPSSSSASDRKKGMRDARSASFYSEDYNSDDSRTLSDCDEQTLDTDYNASTVNESTVASSVIPRNRRDREDSSFISQSDYESDHPHSNSNSNTNTNRKQLSKRDTHRQGRSQTGKNKYASDDDDDDDDEDDDTQTQTTLDRDRVPPKQMLAKPLASSFAKRCYFTKAGIGKTTQHYEGLTLTGNVVLMLATAMKLKGCPTICDEDLRRVEQTYPNQFSRLPDELLLSSGWRRISKYCHFSNKPIPDGIPFFHSKQRLHPQGGYYFLLAAAVGMVRPIDVEPLTRDTLVLLETDYPSQCDAAPAMLIEDPDEWTLVNKFCFFSGGPINTEEDVYYQADFDGNPIYMLAFLSPSLTPEELYKLEIQSEHNTGMPISKAQSMALAEQAGLTSVAAVQDVESVYDLTDRDFHDLKLYHLGPCRALPQYILQPPSWTKVLPPHFLEARHRALLRAQEYEMQHGGTITPILRDPIAPPAQQLTVGATPIVGRTANSSIQQDYDEHQQLDERMYLQQQHQQQEDYLAHGYHQSHQQSYMETHFHQQHPQEPGYYMHGNPSKVYQTNGPDDQIDEGNMGAYEQQQYQHDPAYQQEEPDFDNPHYQSQQDYEGESQLQYSTQPDDPSGQPSVFHREVTEEGAFLSTNQAPMDAAIATRLSGHGMDPPERGSSEPDVDESAIASHGVDDGVRDERHNTMNEMVDSPGQIEDSPSYIAGDENPQYPYDDKNLEQARDDRYYDSPECLKDQNGSQDHEFFNAHSGGVDDEDEFAESYFDHGAMNGRHPDDHFNDGAYYENDPMQQEAPRPDFYDERYYKDDPMQQEAPGPDDYGGESDISSPIKADHLRRLGREAEESPKRSSAVAAESPMSQGSAQSISEFSHTSAMKGAQELLKRNRQRRHEQARKRIGGEFDEVRNNDNESLGADTDESRLKSLAQFAYDEPETPISERAGAADDASTSTWGESANSDALHSSVISGGSGWTDSSNPADRSSRRALILQMAKARMKSNKDRNPAEHTIKEEKSSELEYDDESRLNNQSQFSAGITSDIDFAADLD